MNAHDWHGLIAPTPIEILSLDDSLLLTGLLDGVAFTARLPCDGRPVYLAMSGPATPAFAAVAGSTGGAPLAAIDLLIAALRGRSRSLVPWTGA